MATSRWTVIALALCGSCVGDSSRGAGEAAHEPRERAAGRSATAASRARGHRALLRNATRALGGAALDHGCALTATPFVFYHIAKTGGGTVREVMKHTAEKNGKKDVCLHCIKELPNMGCSVIQEPKMPTCISAFTSACCTLLESTRRVRTH